MAIFKWKELLVQWSREVLDSSEYTNDLPREVVESEWLGYPAATDAQITITETRLGTRLPPSYREFLKITNGWRMTTPFINKLWSTDEIDWFSVRHQADWIDAWVQGAAWESSLKPVSDEEYFVYGTEQSVLAVRVEYLQTALEISDVGDSAIYLLNPQIVTAEDEWEAWFFATWNPGANRYRSFWDLMQAEHENFLRLRDT